MRSQGHVRNHLPRSTQKSQRRRPHPHPWYFICSGRSKSHPHLHKQHTDRAARCSAAARPSCSSLVCRVSSRRHRHHLDLHPGVDDGDHSRRACHHGALPCCRAAHPRCRAAYPCCRAAHPRCCAAHPHPLPLLCREPFWRLADGDSRPSDPGRSDGREAGTSWPGSASPTADRPPRGLCGGREVAVPVAGTHSFCCG